jgi:hypothetical protein
LESRCSSNCSDYFPEHWEEFPAGEYLLSSPRFVSNEISVIEFAEALAVINAHNSNRISSKRITATFGRILPEFSSGWNSFLRKIAPFSKVTAGMNESFVVRILLALLWPLLAPRWPMTDFQVF